MKNQQNEVSLENERLKLMRVILGQKECVQSVDVGLVAKIFTSLPPLVPLQEGMLKN